MTADDDIRHMLLSLLQGFYWFDEGLQNYLQARGWPVVTRPQSMVMTNLVLGVRRPSDIARRLGVSRQAIHATLGQMIELGIVELVDDPENGRAKIVVTTAKGDAMRRDAQHCMGILAEELGRRVGAVAFRQAAEVLAQDWGPPMTFPPASATEKA